MKEKSILNIRTQEEIVNTATHFIGFLLSIWALVLLINKSIDKQSITMVSVVIFGSSMILLYAASSIYHYIVKIRLKHFLQKIDHSAIYLLIAGTYTPFTLLILKGSWGWSIFGVIWGLAFVGIILKLFWYNEKLKSISAIAYVLMGLVILIAFKPLVENLHFNGLMWLIAGGVSYISGVFFYLAKKMPFAHGIFHLFVLGGSFCHFIAIYNYVIL
jgi:hemolysin III